MDLSNLEDKYFVDEIRKDIESYKNVVDEYHFERYMKNDFYPSTIPLMTFKELYGYEIYKENGIVSISKGCPHEKPIYLRMDIDIVYIDPEPIKITVDRIKKEMESQLNDASHYDDVYHYTYNPNYGKVVHSGFGGGAWYEFQDGTVKTYLQLLSEGVKF